MTRAFPRDMAEATALSAYAELQAVSNFSFLRGASHADELVERAADLGLAAIGIADRNTLAGAVRAHVAAKAAGLRAAAARCTARSRLRVLAPLLSR